MLVQCCDFHITLNVHKHAAGQLLAQTSPAQEYAHPVHVSLQIQSDGPFPFRILYHHSSATQMPGINLRYARLTSPSGNAAGQATVTRGSVGTNSSDATTAEALDGAAQSGSAVFAFQNVPAGRVFTDAKLERDLLLSGSIAGAPHLH